MNNEKQPVRPFDGKEYLLKETIMPQPPSTQLEMLEQLLLTEIGFAQQQDGPAVVKVDNILACIEGAKRRYADLEKLTAPPAVAEADDVGYREGFAEGIEMGIAEGKALAEVVTKFVNREKLS